MKKDSAKTAARMKKPKNQLTAGDYHKFDSNKQSLEFLADELK